MAVVRVVRRGVSLKDDLAIAALIGDAKFPGTLAALKGAEQAFALATQFRHRRLHRSRLDRPIGLPVITVSGTGHAAEFCFSRFRR